MPIIFLISSLLLPLLPLAASRASGTFRSYDGYQLFGATPTTLDQLAALHNFTRQVQSSRMAEGVEVWNFRPYLNEPSELFVGPKNAQSVLDFLDTNQIGRQLLVNDFGIRMKESLQEVVSHEPGGISTLDEFDLGHYHPFDSIVSYLRLLAKQHGDFIKFDTIGRSFEGRELPLITFGYPSAGSSSKKPALFIDGGIHAREWISPAVALHFINALIHNDDFHSLLADIDIHVVPLLNPDGYAYTWTKDRLWRTTRSGPNKVDLKTCGSSHYAEDDVCYGVDPNRNFPFHWGEAGISKCPCSQVYSGESPLSELECASLAKFISANNETIKAYLTLHSYSNLIIHPFGFQSETYPEDVEELRRVAHAMAKAVADAGGDRFKVGSAPDVLYLVSGSSDDFARSQGIKYTYTMELTSGWYGSRFVGFVYPEEGINAEAAQILPALRVLAEQVRKEAKIDKTQNFPNTF